MNIEIAKQISISDYLYAVGYKPVKQCGKSLWYISPFREEKLPSFKLNMERNLWYDFGIGKGGNIIALAAELYQTNNVSYLLRQIENRASHIRSSFVSFRQQSNTDLSFQELEIVPLASLALIAYLETRCIDIGLAKKECKEAHFKYSGRQYYAIAFPNVSSGYEIRNKYFKACISPKDISYIKKREKQNTTCYVFEGFIDYLSYLTLREECSTEIPCLEGQDYIILNSVSNLAKSLYSLADYEDIYCFFDNDSAGVKAYQELRDEYSLCVHDASTFYSGYNDLNDYLCNCRKVGVQRIVESRR
ncbi:MAG: toprim domain-containing protein [Phocaeicola sp.]